ncbi:MAG TPA: SGNH/GDSL hydrolase family protein [Opitutaceae bacterium]|nr:SGNH/GDSL hydrolase family protein [Opitutaceae bacterium]
MKITLAAVAGLAAMAAAAAPPAFPVLRQGSVVEFIGDSITDGGRARTGNDYNHTMGQSYAFIIAATLGDRLAERNLTFINRGISGNRILDLQARWQRDVLDEKPDLLSILVGVNDTFWARGETLEQFETVYDRLLQETIAALPHTVIVLGEPFVMPVGAHKANYAAEREQVAARAAIVARLAAKYHLTLIRYQEAFDRALQRAPADHWSWDGVHPHYAGHGLMADKWIRAVAALR